MIQFIYPTALQFPLFYYWEYEKIFDGILNSWPIFLWAFMLTLIGLILNDEETLKSKKIFYKSFFNDEYSLFEYFIECLFIGISEEITYRWLDFSLSIILIKISNICLFGWSKYFYLNIESPIINLLFINRLRWLLYNQIHWSIGSGAIIANAKFRNEHQYLGFFGFYNAWCIGFFQFWILINSGLPAAICSHTI